MARLWTGAIAILVREDLIEESVQIYIRDKLSDYDYNGGNVHVKDAFPTPDERAEELLVTTVAVAISFDDGGRYLELGSPMTIYTHTVECWIFATSPKFSRNLSNVIKHIVRKDGEIPLYDISDPHQPQIDTLLVERASAARQMNSSPRPWDQNVSTTTIRVSDETMP